MRPLKFEISLRTIITALLIILGLSLLWRLKTVFLLFFFCLILTEILNPMVNWIIRFKIPRPAAIIILYLIMTAIISFAVAGIIPIFIEQTSAFLQALPGIFKSLKDIRLFEAIPLEASNNFNFLGDLSGGITRTVVSIFSNLFSFILILIITFYLLLERKNVETYVGRFWGRRGVAKAQEFMTLLEIRLGHWVNAQLLLMLIIGLLSYLGYLLIGLNYALPLAIIAALLEILPNIGPTLATILAGIVGVTMSPLTALSAIIVGLVVQQLENGFITPKVMKDQVSLPPLLTIFVLLAGAKLGGLGGAILSIPIYLTFEVIYKVFVRGTVKPNSV